MDRRISASSSSSSSSSALLQLLDPELDSSDVFDPPAWRPGRYLQFADLSMHEEPCVHPVSSCARASSFGASTSRAVPELGDDWSSCGSGRELGSRMASSSEFVLQVESGHKLRSRHVTLSRRTLALMTSCMVVALTALTLLNVML